MYPVLTIGPASIQISGLLIILGIWLGLTISERNAHIYDIKREYIFNSIGSAILISLIGARIAYVVQHYEFFLADFWSIFSLSPILMDVWGGLLSGGIFIIIYVQRKHIDWLRFLDSLTPFFASLIITIPLANLASGNGFGIPSEFFWGINLWGAYRHPVQIYELIGGIVISAWLYRSKFTTLPDQRGMTFFIFLAIYSGTKIFFDYFRADSFLLPGNIKLSQLIAWGVLAFSLFIIGTLSNSIIKPKNNKTSTLIKGE